MKQIPLGRSGRFALVDDRDFDWLSQYQWIAEPSRKQVYVVHSKHDKRTGGTTRIKGHRTMHGLMMKPSPGQEIDHIDHNGLNNQRSNLRLCTRKQNLGGSTLNLNNSSGFKGVSRDIVTVRKKYGKMWKALGALMNRRRVSLGYFATPEEAAKAYDKWALQEYGEFAATNKSLGLLD